jgi:type II secretory pathway component PulF
MGMDRLPEATAALLAVSRWVCHLWFVYWPAAAVLSVLAVRVPPGAKKYLAPATVLVMGACVAFQVWALFLPQVPGTYRMEPPK